MAIVEFYLCNNNNNNNNDNNNNNIDPLSKEFDFINDLKNNLSSKIDENEDKIFKRHRSTFLAKSVKLRSRNKDSILNAFDNKYQDSTNDNYLKKTTNKTNKTRIKNVKNFYQIHKNEDSFMKKVKYYIDVKNKLINENVKNDEVFRKGKTMDNINNELYKNINKNENENEKIKNKNERNYIEEYFKRDMNSSIYKSFIDRTVTKMSNKKEDYVNSNIKNNHENSQKYLYNLKSYMKYYYEKNSPFFRNNNLPFTKKKSSTIDNGIQTLKENNNININMHNSIYKIFEKNKNSIINKKNSKKGNNNNNTKNTNNLNNNNRTKNAISWKTKQKKYFNQSKNRAIIYKSKSLYNKNVRRNCSLEGTYIDTKKQKEEYKNKIDKFLEFFN